jgi:methylated-DNA-protein-cysteine methyltransferase-like protein
VADFETDVEAVLLALRPGEVVTYGEVAVEAGYPGAARAVGGVLARSGDQYPWWRVVAANGRLVPGHEREHRRRLEAEGVTVEGDRVRMRRRGGRR